MQKLRVRGMRCAAAVLVILMVASSAGAPAGMETAAGHGPVDASATIWVVTSADDSGTDTLRQALLDAQRGDTVTFDPTAFPPTSPVTITLTSLLPSVTQGNLTINGSSAGVVLDGSTIPDAEGFGLNLSSDGNTVRGLQITGFPTAAVGLHGAKNNTVGGDRGAGAGPLGQGNLLSGNGVFGLGMWGAEASGNTILGNYIGTGPSGAGPLANLESGIIIDLAAHDNVIGPDNVIAHNGGEGIAVGGASVGNTITQNSIYDNGRSGIDLQNGGNTELPAPLILGFDLTAGTVDGITCPNCAVEVFCDKGLEGGTYKGTTIAGVLGRFSFSHGAPLTGPHLTATGTDAAGNTSPFSAPTSGTSRSTDLQVGNGLLRTRLQAKPARELEDNRMGTGGAYNRIPHSPDASAYVVQTDNMGQKWILALTIDELEWDNVEATGHWSTHDIDPSHDEAVTGLVGLGIEVVYSLAFWDEEIEPQECYTRFKIEDEIERYLEYIRFIVSNFGDRIEYYEMINEPRHNVCSPFNQQNIELDDYIAVVGRAIDAIREEQSEAKIVVGANVLFYEGDYLFGILESELMPLVDGVSWHPFYGQSPTYEPEYYYDYPSTVQAIKDVASAHGFEGEYIAEEVGWGTGDDVPPGQPSYDQMVAAKYYGRGILMHLGMDVIMGFGGEGTWLEKREVRNLSTLMAGARSEILPVAIESTATDIVSYTFSSTNGEHLVTLWTDGIALESDPGVTSTVTLPGFGHHRVVGINFLHDFEQPLMVEDQGGDLVIRDLVVRDYPILLRLIPPERVLLPIVMKAYPQ